MTQLLWLLAATGGLLAGLGSAEPYTPKHEAGRCAIRGHCGKKSFFGKQLPCVDNELAEEPDEALRQSIVGLCGEKWSSGPVCCTSEQVGATCIRRARLIS
jgi:Niemann-Pick C1 protein